MSCIIIICTYTKKNNDNNKKCKKKVQSLGWGRPVVDDQLFNQ